LPYLLVFARLMCWKRIGDVPITSLDDLAMEEYGVEFEQTTPAQQTDLLRRSRHNRQRVPERPYYRVGTYTLAASPTSMTRLGSARAIFAHTRFCGLFCQRLRWFIGSGGGYCRKAAFAMHGPTARWF
jgi:hypothetical protein